MELIIIKSDEEINGLFSTSERINNKKTGNEFRF